jgi:hypothetical protein
VNVNTLKSKWMFVTPCAITFGPKKSFPLRRGLYGVGRLPPIPIDLCMGPVCTAVCMYVIERLMIRTLAGQLMRKGVPRKMRRLLWMVMDVHIILELVQDTMEDAVSN